jgi:hypothetical protein
VERYLAPKNVAEVGLFKPEIVQEIVQAHKRGKRYEMWALWGLLVFHIWHALYISGTLKLAEPLSPSQLTAL